MHPTREHCSSNRALHAIPSSKAERLSCVHGFCVYGTLCDRKGKMREPFVRHAFTRCVRSARHLLMPRCYAHSYPVRPGFHGNATLSDCATVNISALRFGSLVFGFLDGTETGSIVDILGPEMDRDVLKSNMYPCGR